jgi:hypothetical protein
MPGGNRLGLHTRPFEGYRRKFMLPVRQLSRIQIKGYGGDIRA